jgi:CBS domain-containing protein
MKARDLMSVPPLLVAVPTDPLSQTAAVMRYHDLGAVPVVSDRAEMRPVGILTDRDIAVRCVADDHGHWCTVCDHMTRQPLATVAPDAEADEVAALLRERRIGRVLVVEDGRLVGVVAMADLARGGHGEAAVPRPGARPRGRLRAGSPVPSTGRRP